MDGQRRVSRKIDRSANFRPDCALKYRVLARFGGVLFVALAIMHGVVQGGHFEDPQSPWYKLPGRLAGLVGFAADDIKIAGLEHHDPTALLQQIGVQPGESLFGFDANQARETLKDLDWVSDASVRRVFPNQLEIVLAEREPFAVWQNEGRYHVVDAAGVPMSGLDPSTLRGFPLVVGLGANVAVSELVNQLEAVPALKKKVFAAARVGARRWTLYLDTGVKVALPEVGIVQALQTAERLGERQGLFTKGIAALDLRIPGQLTVALAESAHKEDKSLVREKMSKAE